MAEQVHFPQRYQGGSGLGPPICPPHGGAKEASLKGENPSALPIASFSGDILIRDKNR
jgi:hypothetical protein